MSSLLLEISELLGTNLRLFYFDLWTTLLCGSFRVTRISEEFDFGKRTHGVLEFVAVTVERGVSKKDGKNKKN